MVTLINVLALRRVCCPKLLFLSLHRGQTIDYHYGKHHAACEYFLLGRIVGTYRVGKKAQDVVFVVVCELVLLEKFDFAIVPGRTLWGCCRIARMTGRVSG